MIKGTTTIKADDTTTAMEKVVSQLGDDCVILSTKKRNGKIEITASNSPKHKRSVKKRYDKKKFENIYKLNAGKLNFKKDIEISKEKYSSPKNLNMENNDLKLVIKNEVDNLLKNIDRKLENIYVTDKKNLIKNLSFSDSLKLKQLGFSSKVIEMFFNSPEMNNDTFEKCRVNFFRRLSENLAAPYPERIFKSKLILVTGTSGAGKTTMSAKIASSIMDKFGRNNIVLAELCRNSKSASEDLKSFARLLNIPITNQLKNGDLSDTMILNDDAKIVVDLAGDIQAGNKIIEDLENRHGDKNICSILCLQSGSSPDMIKNTWKNIKAQRPIIAITKSDECNMSPTVLSELSELRGQVGIVSGTRSIVDSLLFTDTNVLTEYMKENF
tara:strand:+ start:308 stop:1459 length:1152 start_codon:yes stop_codon:yes gene_type:complete